VGHTFENENLWERWLAWVGLKNHVDESWNLAHRGWLFHGIVTVVALETVVCCCEITKISFEAK
jgi:hypothetical protein